MRVSGPSALRRRLIDLLIPRMEDAPLLAGLAATMAALDFLLRRLLLRFFVAPGLLSSKGRALSTLPLNALAISGAIALILALGPFLVAPRISAEAEQARSLRRIERFIRVMLLMATIAVLGTVNAAISSISFDPAQVLLGAAAAQLLISNLALGATRFKPRRSLRIAAGLLILTAFGAFLHFLLPLALEPRDSSIHLLRAASALRRAGELAFLALPLVLLIGSLHRLRRRPWIAATVGFASASLVALAYLRLRGTHGRDDVETLIYALLQLEALAGISLSLYAMPLGAAVGIALALIVGGDGLGRQRGLGLLLYTIAGFGPLSPALLLSSALGAALILRSIIAEAPHGSGRPIAPLAGPFGPTMASESYEAAARARSEPAAPSPQE